MTIFVIKDGHQQSSSPLFYLRTHPPVRVTPHGAPMLLMTVLDNRKPNKEQSKKHFKSVFVNVSAGAESKHEISIPTPTKEPISCGTSFASTPPRYNRVTGSPKIYFCIWIVFIHKVLILMQLALLQDLNHSDALTAIQSRRRSLLTMQHCRLLRRHLSKGPAGSNTRKLAPFETHFFFCFNPLSFITVSIRIILCILMISWIVF